MVNNLGISKKNRVHTHDGILALKKNKLNHGILKKTDGTKKK